MRSERTIVGLVGAVQFVNIVDFMMVMPMGPDFARGLGVDMDKIGIVAGAYTLAAAVTGLVLSPILDRFDRRLALAVCMGGLALGTVAGGFAVGLGSLVAARVVAGAFGGPATSVAMSIVADAVPPERRGRAMGAVMGAFSVASVLGVPAGLWLSDAAGWRAPFFVLAAVGAMIATAAIALLPPLRGHLAAEVERPRLRLLLVRAVVWLSLSATALVTLSAFTIIPNLSAFIQFNMGWPREGLPYLYMVGGGLSFLALRLFGAVADRLGAVPVFFGGTAALIVVGVAWFGVVPAAAPVWLCFPATMVAMSARNVAYQALLSRVAAPSERAAFQSLNSAVQHAGSSVAAFLGSLVLGVSGSGALVGMPALGLWALCFAIPVPFLLAEVGRRLAAGGADRVAP